MKVEIVLESTVAKAHPMMFFVIIMQFVGW